MKFLVTIAALLATGLSSAETLPFQLTIAGAGIDQTRQLELSDLGEGKTSHQLDFTDAKGKAYRFDLNYKALPANRSYPSNLDITLRDAAGNKLGYLFFAINGVGFLKQMGEFGLIVAVDGQPVDIRFNFDADKTGKLRVAELGDERLVQDTLVPKFGFQMIRPVILPLAKPGLRSQSYDLDGHPFAVNYSLVDIANGGVQFQYNLYRKQGDAEQLLQRIYFNADSLETLREGMFAGKYFDAEAGSFKLVFYPALGQTGPKG
jgi:hypothetical protein